MISPDLAETVKRLRERHEQAVADIQNNFGAAYSSRIKQDSYSIHQDRAVLLDALEGLERTVAFKDETNARLQACLEGEVKLKARVASLESSLAEARKGARTKGTVEVCEKAGALGICMIHPKNADECRREDCPIQHPTAPQETAEKEGE